MNIETVKTIIRNAGFKIQKGIGSTNEFFVSDGKFAITCYATPFGEFEAYSSNEDSDGFSTSDENEILSIVKTTFEEEQNFIADGNESLLGYHLEHGDWR